MRLWILVLYSILSFSLLSLAQQCGSQAGGKLCAGGLCCSQYGYCGNTSPYCSTGCQSQCSPGGGGSPSTPSTPTPTPSGGDISSIISRTLFDQMLKHRNDANCPGKGFYTYDAFIAAAKAFGGFGTTGDTVTRKREIAAFLGQTSRETTGGWPTAPDGPYAWGYCFVKEQGNPGDYCVASQQWPCAPGKKYYGRGPIQISYNYNYGQAGKALGYDLINNPDAVATDPTVSFKTALWFWMTPQSPKPSCHSVITGQWTPSSADRAAGRLPGYGVITNIINGGIECGKGSVSHQEDRIGFYKRYSDIFGVGFGSNLDCNNQRPFA
uniref:Chitinase n=1 Tax=Camellia fraterna TaxID=542725 RepID=A0A2I6RLG3_9ERIC|nr:chitinase [Camellia fraterna]